MRVIEKYGFLPKSIWYFKKQEKKITYGKRRTEYS